MKVVLWFVFAVLAVLWTGGSAALAQLMSWSAAGLAQGGGVEVVAAATTVAMPAWLSGWVDPVAWTAAQQAAVETFGAVRAALPVLGTAVGWLVPAVWVLWGLGLAALLTATLAGHWAIGRLRRSGGALATA